VPFSCVIGKSITKMNVKITQTHNKITPFRKIAYPIIFMIGYFEAYIDKIYSCRLPSLIQNVCFVLFSPPRLRRAKHNNAEPKFHLQLGINHNQNKGKE
jgi:hypothetical protein